jgi:hypothetical protein
MQLSQLENRTSQFPDKVDELLDQVNKMYFKGKLKMNDKEWLKKTLKVLLACYCRCSGFEEICLIASFMTFFL